MNYCYNFNLVHAVSYINIHNIDLDIHIPAYCIVLKSTLNNVNLDIILASHLAHTARIVGLLRESGLRCTHGSWRRALRISPISRRFQIFKFKFNYFHILYASAQKFMVEPIFPPQTSLRWRWKARRVGFLVI